MKVNFKSHLRFLLVLFVFASCAERKVDLKEILSECFWDVLDKRYSLKKNSCYRFDTNGRCKYLIYKYNIKQKTDTAYTYNDADNIKNNTWKQLNDSLIEIRDTRIVLLDHKEDTVKLRTLYSGDTILLIKNCRTVYNE